MKKSQSKWSKRELIQTMFRFRRRGFAVFGGTMVLVRSSVYCYVRASMSRRRSCWCAWAARTWPSIPRRRPVRWSLSITRREAEINSVLLSLGSRSNIEKVLDIVGTDRPINTPIERERALDSLDQRISIYSPKNSTVVVLSALAQTPERRSKSSRPCSTCV